MFMKKYRCIFLTQGQKTSLQIVATDPQAAAQRAELLTNLTGYEALEVWDETDLVLTKLAAPSGISFEK